MIDDDEVARATLPPAASLFSGRSSMPSFHYKALQANGTMSEGQIDAAGRSDAFNQFDARGLRLVALTEAAVPGAGSATALPADWNTLVRAFKSEKISARVLENFTRLLSNLLASGVPLSRALTILHREAATPLAAAKWLDLHASVVDGLSLAAAMAKAPNVFPSVYVAMVDAGETGGFLDVVLTQIADFQSREKELRSKVSSAMLYPCILLTLAFAVLIFLLVFFIPNFEKLFAGFGGALPMITRLIIEASMIVRSYGLLVAAGVFVAGMLVRHWVFSPQGRRVWEGLTLRIPMLGPLVARFAMVRFCRMLGTLLAAGVPLVHALEVARQSLGNQILVDAVSSAITRVQEGSRLGQSLADCRSLFPGSVVEMVSVAEESGRLDAELVRVAGVTEGDLDRQLRTAVAFAEPLMLFLVAGFIGAIFIGMLLPIFTLQEYIK